MSDSVRPHRRQPTRPHRPWDSPGKNTGVGCHFLLQCMKVKSESEVAQSCPTLSMDCSLPGSSVHGIFQARVLEWGVIAFSICKDSHLEFLYCCNMHVNLSSRGNYGNYFTFTFHLHALEKEMATHSSVLAWRIPGTVGPGGLPSMGSHRVGHD